MKCPTCNQPVPDCPDDHYPLVTLIRRGQPVQTWLVDAPAIGGFVKDDKWHPLIQVTGITETPLDNPKQP